MSKPVIVGLLGYGFMGRAHANAYRRVPSFFPDWSTAGAAGGVRAGRGGVRLRRHLGLRSVETDWRGWSSARCRRGRHLRAEQSAQEIALARGRGRAR